MKFKFLDILVYIHPSFFLLLLLFVGMGNSMSIITLFYAVIIFISLLTHEYGHGLTAKYFGASPKIELNVFGGLTSYNNNLTKKQSFFVTLNGPLLEGFLILVPYCILKINFFQNQYIIHFLYLTMKINIFWCILNLMPLYPLDGGKLLRHLLEGKFGEGGAKISVIIGVICAIFGSAYFFSFNSYFIGSIFLIYGFKNIQSIKSLKFVFNKANTYKKYNEGLLAIKNNELSKAKMILKKLLKSKSNQNLKTSIVESLADVLYKEKKKKEAYNLLLNSDHSYLKKGKVLLCKLAYDEKNYSLIERYAYDIYEINPALETAILNSKAFSCLNKPNIAVGWIKTVSLFNEMNKHSLDTILEDVAYNNIKENKEFKDFICEY